VLLRDDHDFRRQTLYLYRRNSVAIGSIERKEIHNRFV
jgi:hypothetical protein